MRLAFGLFPQRLFNHRGTLLVGNAAFASRPGQYRPGAGTG